MVTRKKNEQKNFYRKLGFSLKIEVLKLGLARNPFILARLPLADELGIVRVYLVLMPSTKPNERPFLCKTIANKKDTTGTLVSLYQFTLLKKYKI